MSYCIACNSQVLQHEAHCRSCGQRICIACSTGVTPRPLSLVERWYARPIRWSILTLCILSALISSLATQPGFYYPAVHIVLTGGFFVIGIFYALARFPRYGLAWRAWRTLYPKAYWREYAFLAVFLLTLLSLQLAIPLHIAFAFARPRLERELAAAGSSLQPMFSNDFKAGIYTISAKFTSHAYQYRPPANAGTMRFVLASDPESYFVYAPDGFGGFLFNPGASGYLTNHWFWVTED